MGRTPSKGKKIRKRKVGKEDDHQVLYGRKYVNTNINKRRGESVTHDPLNLKVKVVAVKVYLQRVRLNKSKYKINVLTGSHKGIKYKYDLAEDLAQDSNPYLKIYSR